MILNSTLDAVIIIDAAGIVHDWNRRAEALFGWTAAEAVGRRMSDLIIPPQYRVAHERGMSRFLTTGVGPILGRRMELPRLDAAAEEGLHAAFALPVLVRQEVAIIFEFFSPAPREPEADLIAFADSLAGQLGLYLERKAAEEEVRSKEPVSSPSWKPVPTRLRSLCPTEGYPSPATPP